MRRLGDRTSSNQVFEVPMIATDLRQEELIHQIADSLQHLQHVMDEVFSRVQNRVAKNRTRLNKINDRAKLAQAKVDHIKGRKKATQVFSSSKYPAPDSIDNYRCLYNSTEPDVMKGSNFKMMNKSIAPPSDTDLRDKFKFHEVEVKKSDDSDTDAQGLGRLPNNIDSVSSMLLFNTSENPYKKYIIMDPRGVVMKIQANSEEDGQRLPDEAPTTITEGAVIEQPQVDKFIYQPDIGNVPDIAVPDHLPDLWGVADDLTFMADTGPSIAPSVFGTGVIPDLPEVVSDSQPVAGAGPPPPPADVAPPPPPPAAAPPPPPPADVPPPPPAPAAPPPPPPPPSADDSHPPAPASAPAAVSDDGGRSSLMDAIRKAGGAGKTKLRNAANRKVEKKKEEKAKSSGGGDLMSDLASMLTMRRRGIAGSGGAKQESEKESAPPPPAPVDSGNAMAKMSEMIPYNPAAATGGDDGEWSE